MKAKDLMIGDWILYNKKAIQVDNISADSINTEYCWNEILNTIPEEDVLPIPLTPEILEKNGFHYTNNHTLKGADTYVLRLDQRGFDLIITIKLNDYIALDSYDDRMYRLAEISTGKWCVHHLQHALRLCGIEKEIEL